MTAPGNWLSFAHWNTVLLFSFYLFFIFLGIFIHGYQEMNHFLTLMHVAYLPGTLPIPSQVHLRKSCLLQSGPTLNTGCFPFSGFVLNPVIIQTITILIRIKTLKLGEVTANPCLSNWNVFQYSKNWLRFRWKAKTKQNRTEAFKRSIIWEPDYRIVSLFQTLTLSEMFLSPLSGYILNCFMRHFCE